MYQIPRRTMLVSWIQSLNLVRNICAHHGRLWNRPMAIQPAPPRGNEMPLFQYWSSDTYAKTRLYAIAAIIQYFLRTISPMSMWGERLKHDDRHPSWRAWAYFSPERLSGKVAWWAPLAARTNTSDNNWHSAWTNSSYRL